MMISTTVAKATREARDKAYEMATQAAGTIEAVSPTELVSEGCITSALNALEEARNELLRAQVMVEHNHVIEGAI